jgi:hypothetical protein
MTTARLISPQPLEQRRKDGRRILQAPVVVDLGVTMPGLWGCDGVSVSEVGLRTVVTVPKGFDTDWSSIPIPALLIMGDSTRYDIAGIVHDWLYRVGAPRRESDRAWRLIARSGAQHVSAVRGFLGWAGLRIGGWVSYRRLAAARE